MRREALVSQQQQQQPPTGRYEGPIAPVILSIVGIMAWLVFILLFALYWSEGLSLFQNIIVTVVSFLIAGLVIGLMWMPWFHITGERR